MKDDNMKDREYTPKIKMTSVHHPGKPADISPFGLEQARKVLAFHQSMTGYAPTPLVRLHHLAEHLGIKELWVKDESYRFGLNSFKALGGSYAMSSLAGKGAFTAVTATDGNHGRSIAWSAQRLGGQAYVYLPRSTAEQRLQHILDLGAHGEILDMSYDDTVRYARKMAQENGWLLFQDTAWEGYTEIPTRIMQGYTTMALEAAQQLAGKRPTHIFLQAGVGSMAAALIGFFADTYGKARPRIIIVEPNNADCFFRTAAANDGKLHYYPGRLDSIMAGLCCGEPSPIAWEIIHAYADHILACDDSIAADGMRILGNPLRGDVSVISGESGAVTTGITAALLTQEKYRDIREALELDSCSEVLCFSTEGDTDSKNYRDIVWYGKYDSNTGKPK